VDADRFLLSAPAKTAAPAGAAAPASPAQAPPSSASDTKVDLTALRDLHVNGSVRIGRLRAKGTDLADVKATVRGEAGRLDVVPFSLRVHGGTVNGRIGVDARANRITTSGSVAGLQLRSLNAGVGGRAAIEGSASGTFDLSAAGATTNQMKRALAGTAAVEVRDGALVGIDLADLIGTASALLQSRGQQKGALDENKRTPFSQLSASVRIKDGVAYNDDLKAKSAQLDIAGRGTVDVGSSQIDYALQAQVLPGPATERSPLRSVAGLSVPVRVTGPLEKPSYAVDWAPVAAQLLTRRATGTVGTPSVDRVIEGLGDLLRRRK
jgi:AsmA protein